MAQRENICLACTRPWFNLYYQKEIRPESMKCTQMYRPRFTVMLFTCVHTCTHSTKVTPGPRSPPSRMWLCLHHSVLNIRELLATICIFLFLSFPSVSPFSVPSLLLYKARPQGGFSLTRGPSSQTCTSPEPPNQPKVLEEEEVPQLWPRSPSWDLNSQGHHSEFAQHLTVSCSA